MTASFPVKIDASMTVHKEISHVISALKAAAAHLPVVVEQPAPGKLRLTLSAANSHAAVSAVEELGPTLEAFDGLASVDNITVVGQIPAGLTAGLRSISPNVSFQA